MEAKEGYSLRNIYFSSTLLWQDSLEPIFRTAMDFGVDGIEFWAEQADYFHYAPAAIRCFLQQNGMRAVVHSKSWDLNYASLNPEICVASLQAVMHSVDFANQIGAVEVTIHPPRYTMRTETDFSLRKTRESLAFLADYAAKAGVMLSLEIMEKNPREIVTDENGLRFVLGDLFERFAYTVDTAHCDCEHEIFALMEALPASKMHISNRQGRKLHTSLLEGNYSFVGLLPRLLAYEVPLVIEGTGYQANILQDELAFTASILRQMEEGYAALYESANCLLNGSMDSFYENGRRLRHG